MDFVDDSIEDNLPEMPFTPQANQEEPKTPKKTPFKRVPKNSEPSEPKIKNVKILYWLLGLLGFLLVAVILVWISLSLNNLANQSPVNNITVQPAENSISPTIENNYVINITLPDNFTSQIANAISDGILKAMNLSQVNNTNSS